MVLSTLERAATGCPVMVWSLALPTPARPEAVLMCCGARQLPGRLLLRVG
ncbi:MAG TPA: hypothetical protein VGL78_12680 [Solirubrobacteraceae bacterium]